MRRPTGGEGTYPVGTEVRRRVLRELRALRGLTDTEAVHSMADDLIMEYLRDHDPEIADAFAVLEKWYA